MMLPFFSIKGSNYKTHFWYISKNYATNIMTNCNLKKKWIIINFLLYLKFGEKTYYQGKRETILNSAKYYYENNKEVLREKARNKYRELSDEEKNIKREYGRNRDKNMSEEKKQRLKEYQKNYHEANKTKNL